MRWVGSVGVVRRIRFSHASSTRGHTRPPGGKDHGPSVGRRVANRAFAFSGRTRPWQRRCAGLRGGSPDTGAQISADHARVQRASIPGKTLPITVLLLVSPEWGNAPFRQYLDNQTFLTLQIIAGLHDPGLPLPPHHLVINAVSDADSCRASLEAAAGIVAQSSAPCVNLPAAILATTREQNAQRLGTLDGVRTPCTATISRELFTAETLSAQGFGFPLLVRAPGYHTGQHFVRVESAQGLPSAISALPGETISAIEFS